MGEQKAEASVFVQDVRILGSVVSLKSHLSLQVCAHALRRGCT